MLLEAMVAEPWRPVGDLRLFATSQRQRLLTEWGVGPEPPQGPDIIDLIAERALENPNAVAVQCEAEQITYGQLEGRANQLARLLRVRGVGPGVIVGVCLERSPDHVVALLGVLKAGGAFVPAGSGGSPRADTLCAPGLRQSHRADPRIPPEQDRAHGGDGSLSRP